MVNHLMSQSAVVLEDIVILRAQGSSQFLRDRLPHPILHQRKGTPSAFGFFFSSLGARLENFFPTERRLSHQDLLQLVIRDVGELHAMVFGDHELEFEVPPRRLGCQPFRDYGQFALNVWVDGWVGVLYVQYGPGLMVRCRERQRSSRSRRVGKTGSLLDGRHC